MSSRQLISLQNLTDPAFLLLDPCHLIFRFWYICLLWIDKLLPSFSGDQKADPGPLEERALQQLLVDQKKLLIPRNSEEHEHEWILNIGIMAKNWPAPPKIFTIWRHPSEAGHKKETRRLVQGHQKSSVNVICQALLLTTCPLFLSSASLSPRPLETSSPTLPSGSLTSVLSKQPMLFAP